ncbi:MAG: acyl-CoA dehydrogenase family protein [Myxococcales bacterium]|nr:acyl-CoA dehydrogenase family protein [Myxococcales bacterium]
MSNFFTDNSDLRFYFEKAIPWAELANWTERGFRLPDGFTTAEEAIEFYTDVANTFGTFCAKEVAPIAAKVDRQGLKLVNGEVVVPPEMATCFKKLQQLQVYGLCVPRELGGLNCPLMLNNIFIEMMARADVSLMSHFGFHGGIAMVLLLYSIHEGTTGFNPATGEITTTRFAKEIAEIISGDAWGSMDITEPDAGSDMAALRAKGEQLPNGSWVVSGQKVFITSGHGKYHVVIARTEPTKNADDPLAGLKGLSLFLVPAYQDNHGVRTRYATVDRLEEKLGHHGSATASVIFDQTPAQLLGKRGDGFKNMLMMMNNARIGVGFESLGLCEAAFRLASDYAEGRRSMGKPIAQHELIADMLDEMQTDIVAIRALAMYAGYHEEMANKLDLARRFQNDSDTLAKKRRDNEIKSHQRKARAATPLLKYFASERAVSMARQCVQIHGGVGYTKEYGAEKLLRDAMVMPIYEGTSQIQALMATKDALAYIVQHPQAFVRNLTQTKWRTLSTRDPLERRVLKIQTLSLSAQQHVVSKTALNRVRQITHLPLTQWPTALSGGWDPRRDFAFALLHAERLTQLMTDALVSKVLWEQVQQFPERREWLDRFLERAEHRSRWLHDVILHTGDRILDRLKPSSAALSEQAGSTR